MCKISVIVPVYNMEKYLGRCVESLLNQTMSDIEIILVDDGSEDTSPSMCDDYAEKFKSIRVIHKENGGLVSAWKAGITAAEGQYLGFIDPDDYIDADYYEKLWEPIAKDSEIDMAACGMTTNLGDRKIPHKASDVFKPGVYSAEELANYKNNFFGDKYVIAPSRCTKLIRRELMMNNYALFDDRITMCEDVCATFTCFLDVKRLAVIDYAGYQYIEYPVSMSHGFNKKLFNNFDVLCEILNRVVKEKGYDINYSGELVRQFMTIVLKLIFSDMSDNDKISCLKAFRENKNVADNIKTKKYPKYRKAVGIIKVLFQLKTYRLLVICGNWWRKRRVA